MILYKNGVGYFERAGEVKPGDPARLEFNATEMNDVLKSLTVTDRSGGGISGIHYDTSDSLEKRLGVFPFRVGEGQSLAGFLDGFKGDRIELKVGTEPLAGRIVSARIHPPDEKPGDTGEKLVLRMTAQEHEQVILLLDSGELRTVELGSVASLRLSRPEVQRQLSAYLETLTSARSREKRSVVIDSTGAAAASLLASYTVPSPVWKSSYRLLLEEKGPLLEGWAIVDNTTGEDWTGIRLALVSGRPVSFISRLYEPVYRERQSAELPEDQAIGPVVHAGGLADEVAVERGRAMGGLRKTMAAPPPPAALSGVMSEMAAEPARLEMRSSIAATAEGRVAGELFEYSFATPVTVAKNQSVMLPFLQQAVSARKLLVYTYGSSLANPLSAAEITNNTGKTLDGGPITVFDTGTYSGEALMETLKKGDKRLISYGVDQGTRITTGFDSGSQMVREFRLLRGLLTTRSAIQETTTYTINNVDAKAKTIVLEHPARPGYKLLNPPQVEKTPTAYRFEVKLAPSSTQKFPVSEERVLESGNMVSNLAPDLLLTYSKNKTMSEAGRRLLEQLAARKRAAAEAQTALSTAEGHRTSTA
ncbi:MAG: hypothetical protein NTY38_25895 [Acidobacteria bacterium]|nr:hypothetical protein [Acidobacteriota bacterium]